MHVHNYTKQCDVLNKLFEKPSWKVLWSNKRIQIVLKSWHKNFPLKEPFYVWCATWLTSQHLLYEGQQTSEDEYYYDNLHH